MNESHFSHHVYEIFIYKTLLLCEPLMSGVKLKKPKTHHFLMKEMDLTESKRDGTLPLVIGVDGFDVPPSPRS